MAVIRITEYKNRDTISLLREVLAKAQKGEVVGVCLAMKYSSESSEDNHHGISLAGVYFDDPTDVLSVLSRIDFEVNMILREPKP